MKTSPARAFTLLELLIVISIIAILAGVAFPMMQGATNQAKRVHAAKECQNLVQAIGLYKNEYNVMPLRSAGTGSESQIFQSDASFMNILLGEDEELNRREKSFFQTNEAKKNRKGLDKQGNLWDPWGEYYQIEIDADYNGIVTGPPGAEGEIRADAAVWSYGKPKRNGQRAEYKDWVKSWE